jgi:hypothetical protein
MGWFTGKTAGGRLTAPAGLKPILEPLRVRESPGLGQWKCETLRSLFGATGNRRRIAPIAGSAPRSIPESPGDGDDTPRSYTTR